MSCAGCTVGGDGKVGGCQSNGGCSTGGCNRLNTYDWLSKIIEVPETEDFDLVEISFKNGSRKSFFHCRRHIRAITGDMVVVESGTGFDVGRISLSGELVRLQMKKKRVKDDTIFPYVIRRANERDLERLHEARGLEKPTMLRARIIARALDLDMKIGDVDFQGDKRKATFYYTADGRVDFRELIRHFAKDFRVKIEMRQIGARQESARIGGIGSCGRELCCSTWLTDFKSVTTAAARYQNLAINQSKLSGQCGRLKCCLNYELDTYLDALQHFPENVDRLETEAGLAFLSKTDIFKGIMYYTYRNKNGGFKPHPLTIERVKEIKAMNRKGEKPVELKDSKYDFEPEAPTYGGNDDLTNVVELPMEDKRRRRRNRNRKNAPNHKPQDAKGSTKSQGNKKARPPRKSRPDAKGGNKESQSKSKTDAKKQDVKPNNKANSGTKNRRPRPNKNSNKPAATNKGQQDKTNTAKNTTAKEGGQNKPKSTNNKNRNNKKPVVNKDKANNPKAKANNNNKPKPKNNDGKKPANKQQQQGVPKAKNGNSSRPPRNKNRKPRPKNTDGTAKPNKPVNKSDGKPPAANNKPKTNKPKPDVNKPKPPPTA